MIPTIETIIEDLLAGTITKQQAVTWLHMHAEDAYRTLRDDFAAAALTGLMSNPVGAHHHHAKLAEFAYMSADAMLKAREK